MMWGTCEARAAVAVLLPVYGNTKSQGNLKSPQSLKMKASISNSDFPLASRIMVRNVGYKTSESSLQKEFSGFGEIAEVKLVKDETTNMSKGYAFIQYTCQDDAIIALENMDQKILDGRMIYVELARPGRERFGVYPKTCGPPKKQPSLKEVQDEVEDCWY